MAKKVKEAKDKIGSIEDQVNKKFGEVLIPADAIALGSSTLIPTTLSLDIVLSGGMITGSIMSIGGKPKIGKTTLVLTILANAQQYFKKKCYYVDVEGRLRPELMTTIKGLVWNEEQSKATGIPQLQIIRSSRDKFLTAEDYVNIMDMIFRSEPECVVVLDSIAALCNDASFSAEAGEARRMMGIPTLMYEFLRKQAQVIPVMESNLITITHLTADPSRYGTGQSEVGGNAIQFFASNKLVCFSASKVPNDGVPQIGQDAKFKCTASAIGPPAGEAIVYIRYGRGCDHEEDVVSVAEEMGMVNRAGAWYNFKLDGMEEEIKIQGKPRLVEFFKENPLLCKQLETDIRQLIFGDKIES